VDYSKIYTGTLLRVGAIAHGIPVNGHLSRHIDGEPVTVGYQGDGTDCRGFIRNIPGET